MSIQDDTEAVGRSLVLRYEASQGRTLRSVEGGWHSGLPGLKEWTDARVPRPGPRMSADFIAYRADGSVDRVIEMKCRGAQLTSIGMKERQLAAAAALGEDYWLYAAFDCRKDDPFLVIVPDPARLPWKSITNEPEDPRARKGSVGAEQTLHCLPNEILAIGLRVSAADD